MATMPPPSVKCRMLCHCLRVTEDEVRDTVESGMVQTVRDVVRETGAGSGCNACHHRIRAAIAAHAAERATRHAHEFSNGMDCQSGASLSATR